MDFLLVFKFLVNTLQDNKISFALIGGFAMQCAGVTRTTLDIDLIILSENAPKIKEIMLSHGYNLIHESEDILNFVGKKFELGRVDFLLAHRKYTLAMLKRAKGKSMLDGQLKVKVLRPEDLIGLKIQSSSNDPQRLKQDMADITALITNNYSRLDTTLIKEYFSLFNREKELKTILKDIKDVK